jgi:hypothetical protein
LSPLAAAEALSPLASSEALSPLAAAAPSAEALSPLASAEALSLLAAAGPERPRGAQTPSDAWSITHGFPQSVVELGRR